MSFLSRLFGGRRGPRASSTASDSSRDLLRFKSEDGFIEYARKFMKLPPPGKDATVLAQVAEAIRGPEGGQIVSLLVITADGEWPAVAPTCGRRGPDLQPGELVLWRIVRRNPDESVPLLLWLGFVFASVEPTITSDGQWRIKNDYPFDNE